MHERIFTIGHSNHAPDVLLNSLRIHDIGHVVDVRSFPQSRRHPHFNREALTTSLREAGIAYTWMGRELGGLRKARTDSRHRALDERGSRGFADHMATRTFTDAIARLITLARDRELAVMCAEANAAACHRRLIADQLVVLGVDVRHIGLDGAQAHILDEHMRLDHDALIYDRATQSPLF